LTPKHQKIKKQIGNKHTTESPDTEEEATYDADESDNDSRLDTDAESNPDSDNMPEYINHDPIEPIFASLEDYDEGDILIVMTDAQNSNLQPEVDYKAFTMRKRVAQKVKPVSSTVPEELRVRRTIPRDPLATLEPLPRLPPEFVPTQRLTQERIDELKVNYNGFLQPEEEKLFKHILILNEKTLPFEEQDRGTLSKEYFSDYIMPTVPHIPWEFKNIPIPPGIREKVIEMLQSKIRAGVYEPSQSSYRCKWFCVLKKNGSLRFIHDLQPLNKVSIRDAGLLPVLDEFVEPFAGRQCYTSFDLFWGYDARIVDPISRDLTAFYTPLGLLRLTCLPMGYTNSPAEFQTCMTFIIADEIPHTANIFIDDLPIRGPATQYLDENGIPEVLPENPGIRRFIWEHANDVHRIMHKIKCAGATFSPKKTQICRPEVVITGHKCSIDGRVPEETRTEKVLKWPVPRNITEVRGFLGLCGTVRIWIANYSQLARPLTELVRKDTEFVWDDRRQEAFDLLKSKVTTAPALRPIDYKSDKPIILSVDTSHIAVGMILSQEDEKGRRCPSRYGSLPLNEREARYSQPKLELYGLYRALRHWRYYVIGCHNLIIEVDAKYINGMINDPELLPNAAMNRWIEGILLFDFTLVHVPAARFKGPDALSRRRPTESELKSESEDNWLDYMVLANTIDDDNYQPSQLPSSQPSLSNAELVLVDVYKFLTTLKLPNNYQSLRKRKQFANKVKQFYIGSKARMYKRNGTQPPSQVIFRPNKRAEILVEMHDSLGHKGEQAVYDLIKLRYYWPHMRTDVHHHVAGCHQCQIRSLRRIEVPPSVSTPATVFSRVYIDVMTMNSSAGFHFIVACKDDLTGAVEAQALRKNNATSLADFFWERIYCRYGAIGYVTTDNGSEVQAAFTELLKRIKIPHVRITRYNKRANGVVERGHFILRESIIKSSKKNKNGEAINWHTHIPIAVFADRVTVSTVTGYSPFYLLHGVHPVLPLDIVDATFLVTGFHSDMTAEELLTLRMRQLSRHKEDIEKAAENLRAARFKSREQFIKRFEKKIQNIQYKKGDLVLKRNFQVESTINKLKFVPRYLGPFEVVRQTTRGNYLLKELNGAIEEVVTSPHVIVPYIQRNSPFLEELAQDSDEEEMESVATPVLSPEPSSSTDSIRL
jgi:hypothetical protein